MKICDYHTHTPLCMHAEGEPEEYVRAAIERGLLEYGVADHAPALPEPFDDWRMLREQLPAYYEWVERARAEAAGRIPIRIGMECDWVEGCEDWITELRGEHDWDYLIGSVHYLADKWDFDNPVWLGRWAETDVDEVWTNYWRTYERMVRSGLFDIHGHPDLIKKFGYRPEGDLRRYYAGTVEALAEQKATIELNTAGWHKQCAEQYPALEFLQMCAEAGVALVISSDAHAPAEVGRNFEQAQALAQEAGYTELVRIEQGQQTPYALNGEE